MVFHNFILLSQFLTDLLCSSDHGFKNRLDLPNTEKKKKKDLPKKTALQLLQSTSVTMLFLSSVATRFLGFQKCLRNAFSA